MNRFFLFILRSPIIIVLISVVFFSTLIVTINIWVNPTRVADSIEAKIKLEIPNKATKSQVYDWISRQEWSKSCSKKEQVKNQKTILIVDVNDTTDQISVKGTAHIIFSFDSKDKLQSFTVDESFTGL